MDTPHALVYYRKNYLAGVARPGALSYDGTNLTLRGNDLDVVWSAPLDAVRVKKGMGILTVRIKGEKTAILTAIGGATSPAPSDALRAHLESAGAIPDAPSVDAARRASALNAASISVYASGQKSLRDYFAALGVLD